MPSATTDLIVLIKSRFSNSAIAVGKAPTPGKIKPSADSIVVKSDVKTASTPSLSKACKTLAVFPAS